MLSYPYIAIKKAGYCFYTAAGFLKFYADYKENAVLTAST